jgi:hypothetical protein
MTEQTNESLIISEVNKLIDNTQKSIEHLKAIAISEAWKLLQLAVATIIQIIESIGKDMEGAEKKKLAMELINDFYDKVFLVVDIPYLPSMLESYLHNYVKKFLMILVSSTIDSMVTIFRNTGVFLKK